MNKYFRYFIFAATFMFVGPEFVLAEEAAAEAEVPVTANTEVGEEKAAAVSAPTGGYTFDEDQFDEEYEDRVLDDELDDLLADDEEEDKVEYILHGYYRVRGLWLDEPDLNRDRTPENLSYFQHRLWLKPTIRMKKKPNISLTADLIVGEGTSACEDPRLENVQVQPCTGIWGAVDGNVLSTSTADRFANISLLRVWGEALTPIGVVRAGRQPSHWGLGLFSNDGEHKQLFGDNHLADTYDRIAFATKPLGADSNLIVALVGDQVVEDSPSLMVSGLDGNYDDVYEGIALALYSTDPLKLGVYQVLRSQNTTKSKILITDAYGYLDIGLLYGGFEMYWVYGKTQAAPHYVIGKEMIFQEEDLSLSVWNWAAEVGLRGEKYDGILRLGNAAGDADSIGDKQISGMSMNPNYRAGLIMFDYANANRVERLIAERIDTLKYLQDLGRVTADQIEELEEATSLSRTRGAVNNAFFLNPVITYMPLAELTTRFGFLWAQANDGVYLSDKPGAVSPRRYNYGYEFDLGVHYLIDDAFRLGLEAAYFIPGDLFDRMETVTDEDSGREILIPGTLIEADHARLLSLRFDWIF